MTRASSRAGLALVFVGSVLFFATWWNRYVSPTGGGDLLVMAPWTADYLPYRDYFAQSPPAMIMLDRIIAAVAGPHLIAVLTFGALLRIGSACALYALLLGLARPFYAAVATLTTLVVSSTDISDTPFYYNHVGASLIVIGTYLALTGAGNTRFGHRAATVVAGAMITWAVFIKQTMIFGAAAACVALVILVLPRPRAGWIGWVAGLAGGAALAVGGTIAWLASHGLTGAFLFVMRRSPEGKGGIARSLVRPLTLLPDFPPALYATIAAWSVVALIVTLWISQRRPAARLWRDAVAIAGLAAAICVCSLAVLMDGRIWTLFLTAVGWWGSLACALLYVRTLSPGGDPIGRRHVALGVLSFGIGYCFAVSWPLFENIAFPGLAVVITTLAERPLSARRTQWVGVLLVASVAAIGVGGYRKFAAPYSWGLWLEPPIYSARSRVDHPGFAGMRLSREAADLYATTARIAEMTAPGDRMFVFPDMPILYAVADRRPATYALAHVVDTSPDFLGREDAARLRADPPKLMIVREDAMSILWTEEQLYRGGQRSSVRDVVQAIDDLKPLYDRVAVFSAPAVSATIVFLVRRESGVR